MDDVDLAVLALGDMLCAAPRWRPGKIAKVVIPGDGDVGDLPPSRRSADSMTETDRSALERWRDLRATAAARGLDDTWLLDQARSDVEFVRQLLCEHLLAANPFH